MESEPVCEECGVRRSEAPGGHLYRHRRQGLILCKDCAYGLYLERGPLVYTWRERLRAWWTRLTGRAE